jgi:hypothetical protein
MKTFHPKVISALLVLFIGIAISIAPPSDREDKSRGAGSFTIAVIPDTQNYVDNTKPQPASYKGFVAETTYLATHKNELNLAFVTHTGDVVEHGDGTNGTLGDNSYGGGAEWDRALCALKVLADADIPFAMAPGNHDYDNYSYDIGSRPLESRLMWNRYFGSKSYLFAFKPWYGGASDQLSFDPGLSSYQVFQAEGKSFLHLALQMEPSDAALAWAQSVIDAHRGYATIITTHSYIAPPPAGDMNPPFAETPVRNSAGYLVNSPGGWNDGQQLWDKFISKNDQIFLVICGHSWNPTDANGISQGENIRMDDNLYGHPVYQVLSDYQGNTAGIDGIADSDPGGEGWIRLMTFDMKAKTIHFKTYSPLLNRYAGLEGESTFGQPAAFSDFVIQMPIQVLNASWAKPVSNDSTD